MAVAPGVVGVCLLAPLTLAVTPASFLSLESLSCGSCPQAHPQAKQSGGSTAASQLVAAQDTGLRQQGAGGPACLLMGEDCPRHVVWQSVQVGAGASACPGEGQCWAGGAV